MHLVPEYELTKGGIRRQVGSHWRSASVLVQMQGQAARRAAECNAAFVPPFTHAQIDVAEEYRALIEWRAGSGIKCASIEAGRGGGGGVDFIDRFIDKGVALARIAAGIGCGVALSVRRCLDRGNGRRNITDRALVDAVVLGDLDLTAVLKRHGWVANGVGRKALRGSLCAALDRMQRSRDG
jgi:hypothetical protein